MGGCVMFYGWLIDYVNDTVIREATKEELWRTLDCMSEVDAGVWHNDGQALIVSGESASAFSEWERS